MNNNHRLLLIIGGFLLLLGMVFDGYYIVPQTQQVILLQFRDVVRVTDKPGIHFKIPFIQSVSYFERRILSVDAQPQEILLAEQKPLEVDAFARYKIIDPLLFFQRLGNERIAKDRLGSVLNADMRSVLGTIKMATLLSADRVSVMEKIKDMMNAEVKDFGVEIVDVRILRADLPQKTSNAVFGRMRSQREQEAAQLRANGKQEALQTKADADRQATIIIAEAKGAAEKMKGEGDRKALQLMADATNKDPQFFAFWRSLAAYRESFDPKNTTFVLNPDGDFFRYFNTAQGR